MKSPTCTILSRPAALGVRGRVLRGSAVLCAYGCFALLQGCGGSAPAPERQQAPGMPPFQDDKAMDKGQGSLNFHYANKSTEARMDLDLGSTDVYLEMSGQRVTDPEEESSKPKQVPSRHGAPEPRPMSPEGAANSQPPESRQPQTSKAQPDAGERSDGTDRRSKAERPPEPPPEGDQGSNEDVTGKVLSGIRRAQELFYQKRYPEALQMVRQSLDAQPTAEGHALAGSIHYMMGQNGLARRNWSEALRLNPDLPSVVNMLERTRTPGGRGSPAPRPVAYHPPAPPAALESGRPEEDAPFPEEYQGDKAASANESSPPSRPAPARRARPAPASAAPAAVAPVSAGPASAAPASAAPASAAPASAAPASAAPASVPPAAAQTDDSDAPTENNDADAEAAQAPPAPTVAPAAPVSVPAQKANNAASKPPAAKPTGTRAASKDSAAVKSSKPAQPSAGK